MSPAQAHAEAHHHILSCAEMLTVVLAAVEGRMIAIPQEHKDGLSTVLQRALDEARAARNCFAELPRPSDPL